MLDSMISCPLPVEQLVFGLYHSYGGLLCSLPHTLGTTSSAPGTPLTTQLGMALYAIGMTFETLADVQKYAFKQTNPKQFCNVGVWALSQHPNYFGNLALWSGFLINAPSLLEASSSDTAGFLAQLWGARRLLLAFVSPMFLWTLFNAQANGSMANTLELANQKYGDDPNYQKYLSTV
eukprot:CAMPEP_0178898406 /NCGR_PEP_ID=MMETSP0786-20121207/2313_1 /TAXON_ID=186022 /ORGANISM="Thalassionema frauenfeldii, Strain CCMP 1798" /LENGTH=177 /DNA_ID=CAMNT_0020569121 /DNA_START=516 /DNA_END=1045 /DNA_ORIENTATION=-